MSQVPPALFAAIALFVPLVCGILFWRRSLAVGFLAALPLGLGWLVLRMVALEAASGQSDLDAVSAIAIALWSAVVVSLHACVFTAIFGLRSLSQRQRTSSGLRPSSL